MKEMVKLKRPTNVVTCEREACVYHNEANCGLYFVRLDEKGVCTRFETKKEGEKDEKEPLWSYKRLQPKVLEMSNRKG